MILKFSPETIKSIGYYVYVLVDPHTHTPFYIGKGSGNRVFSHVNSVLKNGPATDNEKEMYIDSILKRSTNNQVIHYIIRYGLTSEHALIIESVLIDIFNHKLNINLTPSSTLNNIYDGFYSDNGCITAKELDTMMTSKKAVFEKDKKYLAININSLPTGPDAAAMIYQKVRWCWVLNPERANQADYILATHAGIIVGVYKLDMNGWQLATDQSVKNRYFFNQDLTVNLSKERNALIGCCLSNKLRGAQNPVWYVYGW